jgi:hypothetical protein
MVDAKDIVDLPAELPESTRLTFSTGQGHRKIIDAIVIFMDVDSMLSTVFKAGSSQQGVGATENVVKCWQLFDRKAGNIEDIYITIDKLHSNCASLMSR